MGHLEHECRKKQYDQIGKGRKFFPQANNASLQSNTKECEDEDNNFIQAFMCEIEVTQTKDESESKKIEMYIWQEENSVNASNL